MVSVRGLLIGRMSRWHVDVGVCSLGWKSTLKSHHLDNVNTMRLDECPKGVNVDPPVAGLWGEARRAHGRR